MNCLNCNSSLKGDFCHQCGQKATVKRFSSYNLFSIDLLIGLFSFERSKFLRTTKLLIIRPGESVRNYIAGKRVNFFHFLTYLIIMATLNQIAMSFLEIDLLKGFSEEDIKDYKGFYDYSTGNFKLFSLIKIPLSAFITILLFKRANMNLAEHLVLNTYLISIEWLIKLILLIPIFLVSNNGGDMLDHTIGWLPRMFSIYFFYQIFSVFYKKKIKPLLLSLAALLLIIISYVLLVIYPTMILLEQSG